MKAIAFENLTIGYQLGKRKEQVVASELSAVLETGQLTCLLGRNGVGKSTLLRTLMKGTERKNISVVLTDKVDVENITVEELVGLGRTPHTGFWGVLRAEDKEAVSDAMRLVGIDGLEGKMIQTLSDGERQKAMISKALAQQTPIILLDEPTAFLDHPSRREIMRLLCQLAHEQERAILLSTHDVELALQYADAIWFMDDGRLLTGPVHEMRNSKELKSYLSD